MALLSPVQLKGGNRTTLVKNLDKHISIRVLRILARDGFDYVGMGAICRCGTNALNEIAE